MSWYAAQFPRCVLVPDEVPSINAAINRLGRRAVAVGHGDAEHPRGLVLIRPGTYSESVRVTRNCYLLGLGPRERVVVEAPGWESALVFSGLGVRGFGSGEDACAANLTFRCRNEMMRGRCVYIVLGRPRLEHCTIEGGVLVSGFHTAPQLSQCCIRDSWGSGVHMTDHCQASLRDSTVTKSRRHGVLADRGSRPEVADNRISGNGACGIRVFCGADAMGRRPGKSLQLPLQRISGNDLGSNGEGELSTTPRFADSEELHIDADDEISGGEGSAGGEAEEEAPFAVFEPVGAEMINWGTAR